jgi:hypothetical protein
VSQRERSGISGWQAALVIAVCVWIMAAMFIVAPQ